MLCLLLEGNAFFYHDGGCDTLSAGEVVVYDANRPFMYGFSTPMRQVIVEVPRSVLKDMVGAAGPADAYAAAHRAARVQQDWPGLKPGQRAAVLRRVGQLFEDHAEELNSWIVRETGSTAPKAQLETHIAANECIEAASLPSHPTGEELTSNEDRWSFAHRRAAGVVSVISPFNFPLILSIRSVAPAVQLAITDLLSQSGSAPDAALIRGHALPGFDTTCWVPNRLSGSLVWETFGRTWSCRAPVRGAAVVWIRYTARVHGSLLRTSWT